MIEFPKSTVVNKVVPKTAFYKHLDISTKFKRYFVNDIEQIVWAYKFAPSTLNVTDGKEIHEIAIFRVKLKTMECPKDMFIFLDNNIPRHTIFVIDYNDNECLLINYKEFTPSNTEHPYKVIRTCLTNWKSPNDVSLKIEGTSMDVIYENLFRQIAGDKIIEKDKSLREDIETTQQQEKLMKEIEMLKSRLKNEKQPQKKFVLHNKIKEIEKLLK